MLAARAIAVASKDFLDAQRNSPDDLDAGVDDLALCLEEFRYWHELVLLIEPTEKRVALRSVGKETQEKDQ